jgi:predicted MFS family arabinose efflux permease
VIRVAAPTSLAVQVTGQCVIAIAQPLVLNSITKVAARYFPPRERAAAISIGSVALFAGILGAVLLGGPLFDAAGLGLLLAVEAIPALVGGALVLAVLRVPAQYADGASTAVRLTWLLRSGFMWTLAGLVFIGMGTYNAVATWLEPILKNYGEAGAAGNLIAIMTVAGIAGAAVLPAWVARRDHRRTMLVTAVTVSLVVFTAVALRHDVVWIGAWFAVDQPAAADSR